MWYWLVLFLTLLLDQILKKETISANEVTLLKLRMRKYLDFFRRTLGIYA